MPQRDTGDSLDRVARVLAERRHAVALTGAGISVPSGIPDFRSPGGLWERFDPMEYATLVAFERDPEKVWHMFAEFDEIIAAAEPNAAHRALAELEALGVLQGIITQNVDGLHQDAGSTQVIEFHGNGRRLSCLGCGARVTERAELDLPPRCECGRLLKPEVVLFGEPIPAAASAAAVELAQHCAVLLVIGTSATVAPASLIPHLARRNGALLVELNLEPTEISLACDVTLHGDAAEILPRLTERVGQHLG